MSPVLAPARVRLAVASLGVLATLPVVGREAGAQSPAQSLAQRVAAVERGTAELRYAARPGVCGDGRSSFSIGRSTWVGGNGYSMGRNGSPPCLPGPVHVRLRLADGVVTDVRVSVGPAGRSEAADPDLGEVSSAVAADYFLRLAETGTGRATLGAISAAVLADSVSVWRRLLAIAKDSATRSRSTRRDALHWVGRFAAAKIAGVGEDIAAAAAEDHDGDDPRNAAVFALSQLRNHEGVPPLLQIARSHRDPGVRRQALFWLSDSGDPRGVALFEDLLSR
jgi:hypothetical protein